MKISPNLYGRMDGSKFWWFPWLPENSLLCVILRYTVYIVRTVGQKGWGDHPPQILPDVLTLYYNQGKVRLCPPPLPPNFQTFLRSCIHHKSTKIVEAEMNKHWTLNMTQKIIYSIKSYIEHHYNVFCLFFYIFGVVWFLGIFEQFRCEFVILNVDENSLSYHIMSWCCCFSCLLLQCQSSNFFIFHLAFFLSLRNKNSSKKVTKQQKKPMCFYHFFPTNWTNVS